MKHRNSRMRSRQLASNKEKTRHRWCGSDKRSTSVAKSKYAGLIRPAMRGLRELEQENGWLKKIVADLSSDKHMMQDVIKRMLEGLVRRGCWLMQCDRIRAFLSGSPAVRAGHCAPSPLIERKGKQNPPTNSPDQGLGHPGGAREIRTRSRPVLLTRPENTNAHGGYIWDRRMNNHDSYYERRFNGEQVKRYMPTSTLPTKEVNKIPMGANDQISSAGKQWG